MDLPARFSGRTAARWALTLAAASALLLAVFVPLPTVFRGPAMLAALNFAHFLLAAWGCAILCVRMHWRGWAAFAAVAAAAALCEILQGYTGRCPAVSDFLRGLFGACAGLTATAAWRAPVATARWVTASLVAVAVSAWPVSELLLTAARALQVDF
ncbi:MAG: hypothetical protein ACYC6Y_25045 [Thermoguttaceae bacterium]